jgi:hypothetical protein
MTAWIIPSAALVTAVSAVRSTWSPCGLSMLACVTPLGEKGRGNRFRTSALWFVTGGTAGGVVLGLCMAALAAGVHALALSATVVGVIALAASAVAVGSDTGLGGFHLPVHYRQVNERWLDHFRPWVYAAGFGWQIGTGLATYITTATVYLMIVLAALTGNPVWAVALGSMFGLVRGMSVLLGRHITTPDALREFHLRFYTLGPRVGRVTVATELAVAVAVAWLLSPMVGLGITGAFGIAGLALVRRKATTHVGESLDAPAAVDAPTVGVVGEGQVPGQVIAR